MKKLVTVLMIFMGVVVAKAQGYESIFGDSTTQWNIANFLPDATMTIPYSLGDTSSINGVVYRTIYRHGNSPSPFAIREDTITGKAWVYNTISNSENLVYDISLNVSDTIVPPLVTWFNAGDFVIVDSVYYISNRKHIRFNKLLYWHWPDTKPLEFIEGVGPNTGLLFYGDPTILVCAHKDGSATYADSSMFNYGPCMYGIVGLYETQRTQNLIVYPNPASDQITFTLANQTQTPVRVVITDALGRTIREETTTAENPQLNTQSWPTGMYFYRFSAGSKQLASGKFIIAR